MSNEIRTRIDELMEVEKIKKTIPLEEKVNILVNHTRTGMMGVCNCGRALELDCKSAGCSAACHLAYDYLIKYLRGNNE